LQRLPRKRLSEVISLELKTLSLQVELRAKGIALLIEAPAHFIIIRN